MSPLSDNARNAYWRIRGFPVPPLVLLGHRDSIWSVACLPDGERVISGSEDGSVRTWRAQDGRGVGKVMNQGGWVFAVAISSDGQWIATAGEDAKIIIWNARTQEKVVEWEGHSSSVWTLGFSVDSARLVSGSRDGSVVVWSTTTGERLVGPLTGHTGWVFCASFSPQGDEIASCDSRDVRIWNSHSPKAVRDRHFPRGQPFFGELVIPPVKVKAISLAWTPNGLLITGCYDGSIKQFDSSTGSLLAEWKSHVGIIRSIAVSPNGKFIASGSPDHTVRLWDTTTRQQIGPVLQHDDAVHSVAISADGSHLLSGGLGGKARIWSLKGFISQSLLENAPTTSSDAPVDNIAGGHPSKGVKLVIQKPPGSPSIKPNPLDIVQEEAVSSAEGHSSDPPSPPKIRKRIRSVKLKTSNLEHSTQVTAWNLDHM
ncbi:WD40 repeat-like protein [Paxillus ammoniavirescens]|nr:WD40 repeat-like protein [Paxillus ammoniavirescens]